MNAAARFDESASATGSSMRPRGLFDGPFRAGPAQARPARAGRVGGTTGRDSRHGPALSSGRASPALMISCWAVFWAPVFGPCSGWPSWARPIFPALALVKGLNPNRRWRSRSSKRARTRGHARAYILRRRPAKSMRARTSGDCENRTNQGSAFSHVLGKAPTC